MLFAGSAAAQAVDAPRYGLGDSWTYTAINQYSSVAVDKIVREVTQIDGGLQVVTRNAAGKQMAEARFVQPGLQSAGTLSDRAAGSLDPALKLRPFPLEPGRQWRQTVTYSDPRAHVKREVTVQGRVEDWELVKVPAGEFLALRIMRSMHLGDSDASRGETVRTEWEWWVPELKGPARFIVWEQHKEPAGAFGQIIHGDHLRFELDAYVVKSLEGGPTENGREAQ